MTTSTFTAAAASLARQHRIELWDGEQLAKLLEQQRRLLEAQGARPAITPS
jgi:restriction endonuclease Mrr